MPVMIETLIQHEIQNLECPYRRGRHGGLGETVGNMTLEHPKPRSCLTKVLGGEAPGDGGSRYMAVMGTEVVGETAMHIFLRTGYE